MEFDKQFRTLKTGMSASVQISKYSTGTVAVDHRWSTGRYFTKGTVHDLQYILYFKVDPTKEKLN